MVIYYCHNCKMQDLGEDGEDKRCMLCHNLMMSLGLSSFEWNKLNNEQKEKIINDRAVELEQRSVSVQLNSEDEVEERVVALNEDENENVNDIEKFTDLNTSYSQDEIDVYVEDEPDMSQNSAIKKKTVVTNNPSETSNGNTSSTEKKGKRKSDVDKFQSIMADKLDDAGVGISVLFCLQGVIAAIATVICLLSGEIEGVFIAIGVAFLSFIFAALVRGVCGCIALIAENQYRQLIKGERELHS